MLEVVPLMVQVKSKDISTVVIEEKVKIQKNT